MTSDADVAVRRFNSAAFSAAGAVLRGSLAQNGTRAILSVLAIALGVALGYAVQLINGAAVTELTQGVYALSGDADLEVRGPRRGFDEALYPKLARLPEVAAASPVVEIDAKLAGRDGLLRILGIDAFRAALIQPGLVAASSDRFDTLRPDTIFLSPAAARWLSLQSGSTLHVQVGLNDLSLRVAGELTTVGNQRFAVMDIASAQAAFDRIGSLTRIDLRLEPGVDTMALANRLSAQLPPGLAVASPETSVAAAASLSRSYRINLNVLALVALFTGGLLVFSTQMHSVVRRRAQFALLRVLGVTRRGLAGLVVVEAMLVGCVGSIIGLALGFALAMLAVSSFGADLGSGYFRGVVPTLALDPVWIGVFFALGIAAAVLGGLVPALETARAPIASALKAGDEERAFARLRSFIPGVALLLLGAIATTMPPVSGLPLFGYFAIVMLLFGTLMLLPRVASAALALLPLPRVSAPRLALLQLRGAPGQATVSLAAIVASVSLTVSMMIMVASFRDSLETWLDRILPADVYFRVANGGDTAYLSAELQQAIIALPGIRRVDFLREQQLLLDPTRPRVVLQARSVDPLDAERSLPIVGNAVSVPADAPPPVWVSEAAADLYGYAPAKVIELPIADKIMRFTVAGVWRDYGRQQGVIAMERARYIALTGDRAVTNGALWLADGAQRGAVQAAIVAAVPGGERLDFASPAEIRNASLKIFDRTFAVTYALELAAVIIGLVGLSSSFGALVLARRREFGVLRHLGMTRRQIAAMLAAEGVASSAIGLGVGVVLGFAISLILIHVVNRQSFHWGMELSMPWSALSAFGAMLIGLSIATALLSGRGAMSDDVVRAVKDDW